LIQNKANSLEMIKSSSPDKQGEAEVN